MKEQLTNAETKSRCALLKNKTFHSRTQTISFTTIRFRSFSRHRLENSFYMGFKSTHKYRANIA